MKALNTVLGEAILLQNHYGRRPEDVPAIASLFEKYLGEYTAYAVVTSIREWIGKHPTFPTPAEIGELIKTRVQLELHQTQRREKEAAFWADIRAEPDAMNAFRALWAYMLENKPAAASRFDTTRSVSLDDGVMCIGLGGEIYVRYADTSCFKGFIESDKNTGNVKKIKII